MGRMTSILEALRHRGRKPADVRPPTTPEEAQRRLDEWDTELKKRYTHEQLKFAHENWDPNDPKYAASLQELEENRRIWRESVERGEIPDLPVKRRFA